MSRQQIALNTGFAVLVAVLTCVPLSAQAGPTGALPPTAPTQSVSSLPSAQPILASRGASHVAWDGSILTIEAGGDSLRGILRRVAQLTGMKVSGGVPVEPVFGSYGPGPVQKVLGSLFEGMSVNMMLVNDTPTKPKEMILTARTGGATPPSPSQPLTALDEPQNRPEDVQPPHSGRHTSAESFGPGPVPQGTTLPQPGTQENTGSGTQSTDASGQQQSPNGTRTPEQIFEELRRRERQGTASQ